MAKNVSEDGFLPRASPILDLNILHDGIGDFWAAEM